jgi:hypothetical protein
VTPVKLNEIGVPAHKIFVRVETAFPAVGVPVHETDDVQLKIMLGLVVRVPLLVVVVVAHKLPNPSAR